MKNYEALRILYCWMYGSGATREKLKKKEMYFIINSAQNFAVHVARRAGVEKYQAPTDAEIAIVIAYLAECLENARGEVKDEN